MDISRLENVPKKPGVYLWKDKFGTIVYVGKAKDLNSRMKQYFRGALNSYKTSKMVELIEDFEYIITTSEKEALILERNLIEKNAPEFNIKLTDDKRYPYIKVKLMKKLEVSLVYRVKQDRDKALFFGPFPTGFGARKMANLISRLTLYKNGLLYESNDRSYWEKQYDYAKKILSSSPRDLIKELEVKMFEASENMQYEIAADFRETIKSLDALQTNQNVEFVNNDNVDVLAFVEKNGFLSIAMLFYRNGSLLSKSDHMIEIASSKSESIRQFVSQYYSFNYVPNYLISNEEIETEINVVIPQKGEKKNILNIALENANDNIGLKLQTFIRKEELTLGAMHKLELLLRIDKISHILMIDNSNTNNTHPVSAIVSYRNGVKQKGEYRKYNLELNERHSDVDYMLQGAGKYFSDSTNPIPDLFIVDGGIAQINEVKKVAPKNLNIIGLVKNDKHITEAMINLQGDKIKIEDTNLLNFLKGIQIEVDRFAKFHHFTKRKTTLEGVLITIDGIGIATESKLLEHFKSYTNIYNASIEELQKVVSKDIAKKIKEEFKEK